MLCIIQTNNYFHFVVYILFADICLSYLLFTVDVKFCDVHLFVREWNYLCCTFLLGSLSFLHITCTYICLWIECSAGVSMICMQFCEYCYFAAIDKSKSWVNFSKGSVMPLAAMCLDWNPWNLVVFTVFFRWGLIPIVRLFHATTAMIKS